jgi:ribosomal protein S26
VSPVPSTRTVSKISARSSDSHIDVVLVVRVRSREGRRNRAPPPRVRWKDGKKVNPAVAAAEDAKAAAAGGAKA